MTADELFFFNGKESALPLYAAFRSSVLDNLPDTRIEAKKTQISFFNRHLFAAVSFTPVRKAKDRSDPFLTITFGLPYRKESPRIDAAVEPYPHRWTHHVMIGTAEEIDGGFWRKQIVIVIKTWNREARLWHRGDMSMTA